MRHLVFLLLFALTASAQEKPPRATGYKPPTPEKRAAYQAISRKSNGGRIAMLVQNQALPAAFDCREKGWVTPVGDQGNCGSCYLYSTVQTVSAAYVKAGYGKPDGSFMLSLQYGMDCHDFGGCNGGWGAEVMEWMARNGWYAESYVDSAGKVIRDYPPYEARVRTCRTPQGAKKWTPASWGFVNDSGAATTAEIKAAMFNFGTLNLAIDAGGQFGDGAGTITSLGSQINHEIQCVAWDDAKDGGAFLLQTLATVFANFCGGTPPQAGDMSVMAKRGLADCRAGDFTLERLRLRRYLLNEGIRRIRGELNDVELACWEIAAGKTPREIERYAAVWAAEPQ